ncbi:MarR family winged helix-turn-helix transcriptional regulator [Tomitella gaofuii]|uniref:MarR family winged helix-turn-helix transcriptional regulator n=1 Tax=Tomitella gaofuii TaxID=2760083 RepID=UPI0015FDD70E|nr:MarR family transcriptional regulator [Tomitella gaofuii]
MFENAAAEENTAAQESGSTAFPESTDEVALAADLRPVLLRLNNLVRRRVPSVELTPAQSTALTTVLDHGPLRMGELAEREQIRMPTVTAIIRRVEKLGLVQRRPDPDDGRAVLVELTASGRERLEHVARERNVLLAALLEQLTDGDRQAIAAAVPALNAMLALDLPGPADAGHTDGPGTPQFQESETHAR